MNEFYVYAYLDPTEKIDKIYDEIPFEFRPIYIGKGKDRRMFSHLSNRKKFKYLFYNKINKMINNGIEPIIIKLKSFNNEVEAIEFEKLLIKDIGRIKNGGYLYNLTDGGEGVSGYKFDKKLVIRLSNARRGKKASEETKLKMSISLKGKIPSPQTIAASIKAHKGIKLTEEHKNKLSKAKIGKDPWNKGKIKDIILQIKDSIVVKEWNNLQELKSDGFQVSNIINCCSGLDGRKLHKGFYWKYKSDFKK